MDDHDQNPAGRLLRFLDSVWDLRGTGQPCRIVFQQFFDEEDDLQLILLSRDLVTLPDQIEVAVGALHDPVIPAEELLDGIWVWRRMLSHIADMSKQTNVMFHGIDEGTRKVLRTCSRVLNRSASFPAAPEDSLSKLRDAGEELRTLLQDPVGAIDPDLRLLLLEHIDLILRAIATFRVGGRERLLVEIDRYFGHVFRSPAVVGSAKSAPKIFQESLVKFGAAIAVIVAITDAPTAIATNIGSALELFSGQPPATSAPPALKPGEPTTP